uniref:Uncharacterized protein n=1 Tax=Oryza sativa subsp. indica TaxID=39946 RepID=C5NNN8_ORYSI|nr:hypothetical protein [Oryza sativa Indica Group]
MKTDYKTTTG